MDLAREVTGQWLTGPWWLNLDLSHLVQRTPNNQPAASQDAGDWRVFCAPPLEDEVCIARAWALQRAGTGQRLRSTLSTSPVTIRTWKTALPFWVIEKIKEGGGCL